MGRGREVGGREGGTHLVVGQDCRQIGIELTQPPLGHGPDLVGRTEVASAAARKK